jgi:glycine hydroxymethyltransferase
LIFIQYYTDRDQYNIFFIEGKMMSYLTRYFEKVAEKQRNAGAISFYAALDSIGAISKELSNCIIQELKDQRSFLKLIASENFSSLAVQQAMGNLLTDKYAEGVPGKRFYAGCGNVDFAETEAIEEAKKIFNADHAYVQPHSGADANMVALWSIIIHKIQDKEVEALHKSLDELSETEYERVRQLLVNQKLMGMSLYSGGHLTHGYRHNISSKMIRSVSYGVDPTTGLLNYQMIHEQVKKEKPLILIAGYSAYPRLINFAKMKEIADSVKAVLMVDMAHFAGLVAGKVMKGEYDPVPYADIVTSTTHKTLRGPRGGIILCKNEYKETIDKGCPLVLGGPMPHVLLAKAVAFKEANTRAFSLYAHKIVENAKELAESLKKLGVKLITGGTDNHLILVDVYSSFGLTGRQGESALREAMLTCNRNAIPLDINGPWYTSGIRIGTPAITTLGMGKEEMRLIASVIHDVLKGSKAEVNSKGEGPSKAKVVIDNKVLQKARKEIGELLQKFPLYPELAITEIDRG